MAWFSCGFENNETIRTCQIHNTSTPPKPPKSNDTACTEYIRDVTIHDEGYYWCTLYHWKKENKTYVNFATTKPAFLKVIGK